MAISIENLFIYLSAISDFILIVWFFFLLDRTKKDRKILVIFVYCIASLALNYFGEHLHKGKIYYYTIFTLIEYLIFASFFYLIFPSKKMKVIIGALSFMFVAFTVLYILKNPNIKIDSFCIGIETILIILYSFYYMYQELRETKQSFIYNNYRFWIISGILIYLAGSFFIYIFANQLKSVLLTDYWALTNAFYIIKNVFFAIAIKQYLNAGKIKNSPKGISYNLLQHRTR
jgi:hypothetical protein